MRQFNIETYIKQSIGYRLAELRFLIIALLWPLVELWDTYSTWTKSMNYRANLTAQVISIEGNLNKLFDPDLKRIYITDGNFDPMLYFPLNEAEDTEIFFPLNEAEDTEIFIALNEFERIGESDFIVNVPVSLAGKEIEIKGVVKGQKAGGKTFVINYI